MLTRICRELSLCQPSMRIAMLATLACLSATSGLCPSALGQPPSPPPESKRSLPQHLHRIVHSSESIKELRVGRLGSDREPPLEQAERIGWNAELAGQPELRAGEHLVAVELREKPVFVDDEFGGMYVQDDLCPSLEVSLDLFPAERANRGKKLSGRLWASYRGLPIKAPIGFPRWQPFGLFGGDFRASASRGEDSSRVGLSPQELARLKPCQVMTRFPRKEVVGQQYFFTLPMDLFPDSNFDDLFEVPHREIKRVWSSYRDHKGDNWLLWCRKGADPHTVQIRQCVVEEHPTADRKG
jgi:hypothetical protein